jgi:TolB protein
MNSKIFSLITNIINLAMILLVNLDLNAQTKILVRKPKSDVPIAVLSPCVAEASSIQHEIGNRQPSVFGINCGANDGFRYEGWIQDGTAWVVSGSLIRDGRFLNLKLFLHDIAAKGQALGKQYRVTPRDVQVAVDRFSNEILRIITGTMGPFGTKLAFSTQIGRYKELMLTDLHGENQRQLTRERGLAIAPKWSPNGEQILYTSYQRRYPDLFLLDIATGLTRGLTSGPSLEVGGVFSPDLRFVLTSGVSGQRDSDLILLNPRGGLVRRFFQGNGAIDVSPTFAPNGIDIAFCSNRSGSPQIFISSIQNNNVRRFSFTQSNYCTSPTWSPDGGKIAFVCSANGGFQIYVGRVTGNEWTQITTSGSNESPSWSPDSRFLVYSAKSGRGGVSQLKISAVSEDLQGSAGYQVTNLPTGAYHPTWGPLNTVK